jgi:hypothetical protein
MSTVTRDPTTRRPAIVSASAHSVWEEHRWAASLTGVVAILLAGASTAGLAWGQGLYGAEAPSVLVSAGGDLANLVVVLPILLAVLWLARRGSLTGLLLWPGALFYVLYVEMIYLVVGPFSVLSFAHAAAVVGSAAALIGLLVSVGVDAVLDRLTHLPARALGVALVVIALAAYAGLVGNALTSFGQTPVDMAFRGQWAIDMVLGTPALLAGGLLLSRGHPFGYLTAPGLLLVSVLGGLAFTTAALFERLLTGVPPDLAVIGVHLAISAISGALLAVALRPGTRRIPRPHTKKELAR